MSTCQDLPCPEDLPCRPPPGLCGDKKLVKNLCEESFDDAGRSSSSTTCSTTCPPADELPTFEEEEESEGENVIIGKDSVVENAEDPYSREIDTPPLKIEDFAMENAVDHPSLKSNTPWDDSALKMEPAYIRLGRESAYGRADVKLEKVEMPEEAIAPTWQCSSLYSFPDVHSIPCPQADFDALTQQAAAMRAQAAYLEEEARKLKNSHVDTSSYTTVMLRNIPNNLARSDLVDLFNKQDFFACFDFLYLPMDFNRKASLGYAFVNLISPEHANRFFEKFHSFTDWGLASTKIAEVCWGQPLQGLKAHIDRYRNSPVMHASIPADHKPLYLKDGVPADFPPPTKRIRAPRQSDRN